MREWSVKSAVGRRPVVSYFVLTFAFSWSVAGLLYLATGGDAPFVAAIPYAWGPLFGGAVTIRLLGGSVRAWVGQVRNWRVGAHWYVLGVAIVMLRTDIGAAVAALSGAGIAVQADGWQLYAMAFNFLVTLFFAGALEEFGWRGFAQVRLQKRYDATLVSALIGVVWAVWHVPLMLIGVGDFVGPTDYVVMAVGSSVVYSWLYNSTNGVLPVVMVAHAASNMPGVLRATGDVPAIVDRFPIGPSALFALSVVAAVVWYAGSDDLSRDGPLPDVPGRGDREAAATAD
ncbi:CPBP family intramembrane glutamic endopeptidase [Halosimplex halophilum]|uniref:CPBP family intramembrane glutamic endopeptidase n=1 Tax=Halosimplex halophilum TaxID=2559572 RepID=UPI00107F6038|nr:type II CAAX endopeptidase family protein [Halosimplex halophilum]